MIENTFDSHIPKRSHASTWMSVTMENLKHAFNMVDILQLKGEYLERFY